jgi:3-methyladenine DNA glycosylase AlkD
MPKPVAYIADHLRQVLINGASAPHAAEVQHFFKEVVTSRGWHAVELRKLARRFTKVIKSDAGLGYLVEVADDLFRGEVLEEKGLAVLLLETSTKEFGAKEFKLFESWLGRVSSWADHDALASYLIGPMMVTDPKRTARALRWMRSRDRWHRRAAAVSLIRGARIGMFEDEIVTVTRTLQHDSDDMVQKGLGWLLREAAKHNREFAVPLLKKIAADKRTPRLVVRTGCETLPAKLKAEIMAMGRASAQRSAPKPARPAVKSPRK